MKTLIVMALESESQGIIEEFGHKVIYSGVGKVNATYSLMKELSENKNYYDNVLNIGSAGSHNFNRGDLVEANSFVQRDMDATGIGFPFGYTPFEDGEHIITFPRKFRDLQNGICGSGDSFLKGKPPIACDIIDMEAYALAKTCKLENISFACLKYITDGADESASDDWQKNLKDAAESFHHYLKETL